MAGPYLFRSYHLDTFNSANLGFAQGGSSTTPNTLRVGGELEALTQPTALGAAGLNTSFISDADIPTLAFPFSLRRKQRGHDQSLHDVHERTGSIHSAQWF